LQLFNAIRQSYHVWSGHVQGLKWFQRCNIMA
jgi:hypothetical protein